MRSIKNQKFSSNIYFLAYADKRKIMKKLIMFNMVTLDGFFEGPDHNIDWHVTDEEFDLFAIEQLRQIGTILFGRKTYQMMAEFWPTETAMKTDPIVAGLMNDLPKMVFSRTLQSADWSNSRLVKDHLADEVIRMKERSEMDLILFGSADLMISLMREGLIDEFRLMINPVLLGRGRPLFSDTGQILTLDLIHSRPFKSGNVLLTYELEKDKK